MTFKRLAYYFSKLEENTSRLKITEILAKLFSEADDTEVDKICYLSLGGLAPLYEGVEFNLAEKMMVKSLSAAFATDEESVKKLFKKTGDLGEVVQQLKEGGSGVKTSYNSGMQLELGANARENKKSKSWSVCEIYQRLYEVALEGGSGSVLKKINKMASLFNDLDSLSAKYAVRIPIGRLRLGFSQMTILDALSWMIGGDKSKRGEIEAAYNLQADIGQIAKILKNKGLRGLKSIKINLGTPIMPALSQRLPTPEEMIEKLGRLAAEPKYDGTRLLVHFRNEKGNRFLVRIFTRNLENVTHMFPDIVAALFKEVKCKEVIFDGEAIGFDPKSGRFLPFQETMKRKRKYEIHKKSKEIPLKYFVFDILYKDGKDLISLPFYKRRKILEKILSFPGRTIMLSPQIITDKASELRKYHDEQIKKGLEGVMVKKLHSPYDPGRRGFTWVKFKQEKGKKGAGLADSLDCVVMGYYLGKGKRTGFGVGAFLVGIRESEDSDRILTVSKIGTGLTDEQWRELKKRSREYKVKDKPKQYQVNKNLFPDVWCNPGIVVEIEADNITKSPIHTAEYAFRFPRLVRFRDDKSLEEATTLLETKRLYRLQA